jgi:exodeoxyribonuclease V beta subunit
VPVPERLSAAGFDRPLDLGWRRTSYSALTAAAHEAPRFGSEPEVAQTDAALDVTDAAGPEPDAAAGAPLSPWSTLRGGTAFGTLVHAVLEQTLDPVAVPGVVAALAPRLLPAAPVDALADALAPTLATPLGPLADDRPLAAFGPADRLPELEFELPLAGGDEPRAVEVLLAQLVPLWRSTVPEGRLAAYADALARLEPAPLRGYLTGSIDAVLRVGSRYVVVDYKTNRLAPPDEPLTAWHYRPAALEQAMIEAHYPLQALLYSVALHRFLRWRLPGYDPARHLGGTLYLFLRGMLGDSVLAAPGAGPRGAGRTADDPEHPGVFAWRPPSALVTGASDLLAGLR